MVKNYFKLLILELVGKGLELKKKPLAREFRKASQDKERNAEIEVWDLLSKDGLDETNTYSKFT